MSVACVFSSSGVCVIWSGVSSAICYSPLSACRRLVLMSSLELSNLLLHNGRRLDKHYAIGYGLWGDAHLWRFPGFLGWSHFGVSRLRGFLIRSACCLVRRFIFHLLFPLSARRRLVLTSSAKLHLIVGCVQDPNGPCVLDHLAS